MQAPFYGQSGAGRRSGSDDSLVGPFRLGLGDATSTRIHERVMTILARVLVRVVGKHGLTPGVAWMAIAISALAFGAIHLPQLATAGAATPVGVAATMFGNTLVGTVFGWFYWRHGIIAAMTAHFAVDLMLHVIPAI